MLFSRNRIATCVAARSVGEVVVVGGYGGSKCGRVGFVCTSPGDLTPTIGNACGYGACSATKRTISGNSGGNIEIVLAGRPAPNEPVTLDQFRMQDCVVEKPGEGEVAVQTLSLSADPYMRCRFNADTGVDYVVPFVAGEPIESGGVGRVVEVGPGVGDLKEGDLVVDPMFGWPWKAVANMPAASLTRVPLASAVLFPPSFMLGAVGQTGITAYFGMLREVSISGTDVVVVSGAAGAVGIVAGQLAKLANPGCRTIGIAGSDSKCSFIKQFCGYDAVVNYKSEGFTDELAAAVGQDSVSSKNPVTVYFDNVGGTVSDQVIKCMGNGAHVILCGQISMYDTDQEYPPPLPGATAELVSERGINRKRYLVLDYMDELDHATAELAEWVASGKLLCPESAMEGLHMAPHAFVGLMEGKNIGKAIVHVSSDPTIERLQKLGSMLPASVKAWLARKAAPAPKV